MDAVAPDECPRGHRVHVPVVPLADQHADLLRIGDAIAGDPDVFPVDCRDVLVDAGEVEAAPSSRSRPARRARGGS
jgi:hypothetical protein